MPVDTQNLTFFESSKLEFHILPGHPRPGYSKRDLHNRAYRHFKSVWLRTLNRRAGEGVFDAYAFFRQDYIMVVTHETDVVAQLFASFLHLDSEITYDLGYFENFKENAVRVLREENAPSLMTLEYASINPKFSQKRIGGLCLGQVISNLGYMFAMTFDIDATTGMPRRLSGTNEKILRSGYRLVDSLKNRCGLCVDIVLGFRGSLRPDDEPAVQSLIETLWKNRIDSTVAPAIDSTIDSAQDLNHHTSQERDTHESARA